MDHGKTLTEIRDWADRDDDIRAVVVTGSVAAGTADRWSDLDVEVFTRDPSLLLEDDEWYAPFGEVLVVEALPNPDWYPTRLVYYVDAKIDFAIAPADALRTARYERPFRVLVDKDDVAGEQRVTEPAASQPSAAEFAECSHWFYAAALMCAKSVVRGELWEAKNRDADLKAQLLRMIEWDHRVRYGWEFDTWHLGKRMVHWMDEDVRSALTECWGRFDPADTVRALWHSVEVFEQIADRTADAFGLTRFDNSNVEDELHRILRHAPSADGDAV